MYKLVIDPISKQNAPCVYRTTDSACIPFDPDNTDYQEYLEWVAEGNTPEEAD
jgi:hypothetical protein